MNGTPRPRWMSVAVGLASVAIAITLAAGCGSDDSDAAEAGATSTTVVHDGATSDAALQLNSAMQTLWGQHMEWTYSTVDAFLHNPDAVEPTLNRLLQNQRDMGDAIAAYYGREAGDQLTELLLVHINSAVPVLEAARDGDQAKLEAAQKAWYANAEDIADFLSAANPENWPRSVTRPMLETHITQTTAYSVDLLKGDYAKAIKDYDTAEHHMTMLADVLTNGIIAQFPEQFAS